MEYAAGRWLAFSSEKSELLIYNPKSLRLKRDSNLSIMVEGKPVPRVDKIRILGLFIQENGYNDETINWKDMQRK